MSKEIKIEVGYHKNGNKRCEIPRLNGQLHGLARWWCPDGKLFIESNYKNGQLHGLNGNKRYEVPQLNGKAHGLARWWWSNGQLGEEINYKNGKMHGLRRWWHDNGFITYFDFWHKGTELVEFEFDPKLKASTPKPNKPIFSTNQFLKLCQRK